MADLLSRDAVVLDAEASSADEAIRLTGGVLVAAGAVDASYVDAMLQREQSVSTYMGEGFAIPLARWMRGELAPLVHEYLAPARIRDAGLFDPDMVANAVRNFQEGGEGNDRLDTQRLWYLLSFELWRERWMSETPNREMEGAPYARAVCH